MYQQFFLQVVSLNHAGPEPLQLLLELSDGHLPVQLHCLQHLKLCTQLGVLQLSAAQVDLRRYQSREAERAISDRRQERARSRGSDATSFLSPCRDLAHPSHSSAGSLDCLSLLWVSSNGPEDCNIKKVSIFCFDLTNCQAMLKQNTQSGGPWRCDVKRVLYQK